MELIELYTNFINNKFEIFFGFDNYMIGSLSYSIHNHTSIKIETLFIEKQYRQLGFASSFLQYFLNNYCINKYVFLYPHPFEIDNSISVHNLISFYQKNGFYLQPHSNIMFLEL